MAPAKDEEVACDCAGAGAWGGGSANTRTWPCMGCGRNGTAIAGTVSI